MILTVLLIGSQHTPKEELLALAGRLEQLQRVSFDYRRILDYGSNGYKHDFSLKIYAEFDHKWRPVGFRYKATSPKINEAFNGSTYWFNSPGKEPILQTAPKAEYFESLSALKNSFFGLAASLKAVTKTEGIAIQFDKAARKFTFEWRGKELAVVRPYGTVEYWPVYEITLDRDTDLPSKIVQRLKDKKDTITTEFKSFNLNPQPLKEADWIAPKG